MLKFLLPIVFVTVLACNNGEAPGEANLEEPQKTQIEDTVRIPAISQDVANDRFAWQKPDFVIDMLGELDGKVIADIGAGTGYFTFRLINKVEKVIAIDIDTNSIHWINSFTESLDSIKRQKVETRLAHPNDPMLDYEEVDGVIIINTIGYIHNHLEYLRNLKRALKPGGFLMIVDFKIKRIPGEIAPEPENRVSILHLEEELEEAGYEHVLTDDTSLNYQYIILSKA